ncbi:Carboxylesterase [Lachnellula occidentalis]|uniref:Carboxylesterase n=1 Tax=Lachnellula occidentalis TaxID=215460 RepID=A0A8H8RT07_9HELO|nr:Carboxylesterase [Lachnellula occidentalis]
MPPAPHRTPYDAELLAGLSAVTIPAFTAENLQNARGFFPINADHLTGDGTIDHTERTFKGPESDLTISIFRPTNCKSASKGPRPCFYSIHGGGMIVGNRFAGVDEIMGWLKAFDAICVSIEYRLAPEHPDPAPIEDSYAGLLYTHEHAAELGIDPSKIILAGISAGGGLAAGLSLLARDRHGPKLLGQLLLSPMLDDRDAQYASRHQLADAVVWNLGNNKYAWESLLGKRVGGNDVSCYAAPGRAEDLSGLSPVFIDVGSADLFRDESTVFASRLLEFGVQVELHIWPGAFHWSDALVPTHPLSKSAQARRMEWLRRLLKIDS